jgi:ubiquinone/menaquinone biosynthesis C-methylase UbiE
MTRSTRLNLFFKDDYAMTSMLYDGVIEPVLRPIKRRAARLLHERLRTVSDPLVLEVACGTGTQARFLMQAGFRTIALDKSPAMVKHARRKLDVNGTGQSVVINGDSASLPFGDNVFNAVVVQFSLHEMDRDVRLETAREMIRVARRDALFLVADFMPRTEFSFSKACIMTAEALAGAKHFKNGRHFVKSGGLKPFLERNGLRVCSMHVFLQGNVGLAVGRSGH